MTGRHDYLLSVARARGLQKAVTHPARQVLDDDLTSDDEASASPSAAGPFTAGQARGPPAGRRGKASRQRKRKADPSWGSSHSDSSSAEQGAEDEDSDDYYQASGAAACVSQPEGGSTGVAAAGDLTLGSSSSANSPSASARVRPSSSWVIETGTKMCGQQGCILEDFHPGLCLIPVEARRRRRGADPPAAPPLCEGDAKPHDRLLSPCNRLTSTSPAYLKHSLVCRTHQATRAGSASSLALASTATPRAARAVVSAASSGPRP